MISLLFFTRSSLAEQDLSGRAGRNLAVRGESRGHQWGGKWPPMGSLSWPPSLTLQAGDILIGRLNGPAHISTQTGDLNITETTSGTVELRTESGDITARSL
ncbi:hypothetical protein [Streptomyces sp. NBC_00145]|uniref:hypothetical protein n=1 Tax=Streptomyces sp. NBC_00145 TaxID=2975666 RepID=UPI002E18DA79